MRISVVIVNWNSGPFLERGVRSLLANAPGCEILVVDNASVDNSLAFADRLCDRIAVLRHDTNLGFAGACNAGWRSSRGESVLLLNPDAEALPGSVTALEEPLLQDAGVWAAAGKLVAPDGTPQIGFNVRGFPTLGSVFAEAFFLDELLPRNRWSRAHRMTAWDHESAREVEQPAAACLLVRRTALEKLRGFDERFWPAWYEDVDFCRRLKDAGGRILFVPRARFVHQGGISLRRLEPGTFLESMHLNQLRYFAKHHGRDAARSVRRLAVCGLRLRSLLSLARPLIEGSSRLDSARTFWNVAGKIASAREERD